MSESDDFNADEFRERLWNRFFDRSVALTDADKIVDDIFRDLTVALRKRFDWSLGETELFLADAKHRADRALANFNADDLFIDIGDAADIAVKMTAKLAKERT
jgi:hypothetical protein